jgi:TPR repeat protein
LEFPLSRRPTREYSGIHALNAFTELRLPIYGSIGNAAEQGFAEAQYRLGSSYRSGRGVLEDYVLAHMWFNIAATLGDEVAVPARDFSAMLMTPDQITKAQRMPANGWRSISSDAPAQRSIGCPLYPQ